MSVIRKSKLSPKALLQPPVKHFQCNVLPEPMLEELERRSHNSMNAESQLKHILVDENKKIKDIAEMQETSIQNFSNKLKRNTIRYQEMLDIAEKLGYEIKWVKIK